MVGGNSRSKSSQVILKQDKTKRALPNEVSSLILFANIAFITWQNLSHCYERSLYANFYADAQNLFEELLNLAWSIFHPNLKVTLWCIFHTDFQITVLVPFTRIPTLLFVGTGTSAFALVVNTNDKTTAASVLMIIFFSLI